MSKLKEATQRQMQEISVTDTFNRFRAQDYYLNPHTGRFARWISMHYWVVLLLYIALVILVVLINFFQVENKENLYNRLRLEITYPVLSYKWCFCFRDNGDRYIYINKEIGKSTCRDATLAGFFTKKESEVTLMIRNTLFDALPIIFSMFLAIGIFLRVIRNTPKVFLELAEAGRLKPPAQINMEMHSYSIRRQVPQELQSSSENIQDGFGSSSKSWKTFAEDLEKSIQGLGGKFLFASILVLGYLLAFAFASQLDIFEIGDFWVMLYYVVVLGLAPIVLGYPAAFGIWMLLVIASFIRKLTSTFEIDIQPDHGDLCGGLKRIGDLCFEIATILIFPAIVVAAFVLLGYLKISIPAFQVMVILIILTLVILATMLFFLPLMNIHRVMVKNKEALQDESISKIAPVKARLRELVGEGKLNDKETQNLDKRLEKLNQLYPPDMKYPTWPFTTGVVLIFYTGQIFPIISVITGIIDFTKLFTPQK